MDWDSDLGKTLAERLREELVIWLTTVRSDGTPVPTPVWFLWEGESILIYTQPNSAKVRRLAANPKAALNLNCDEYGDEVSVFTGELMLDQHTPPAIENAVYLEKYREGILDIQMTPESFSQDYSVPLRFRIVKTRAW